MKKIKGTYDLISDEIKKWQIVEEKIKKILNLYNFQEIRTPIIEYEEIFNRSSQYSEMVSKEMFSFEDKNGRKIALRPEGTVSVIRSYVENKKENELQKLYYYGPFFRYERPQQGRYRQFYQLGIEIIGIKNFLSEIELFLFIKKLIDTFDLNNKILIKINNLGDENSRKKFLNIFNSYIEKNKKELCYLCLKRQNKNILRILDCKECSKKKFLEKAPVILDYLTSSNKSNFQKILNVLKKFKFNFIIDDKLVRGLDYYTDLVFEIEILSDNSDKNLSLGGGGNYNNIMEIFNSPKTCNIGFALGMERLIFLLDKNNYFNKFELNKLEVFLFVLDSKFLLKSFFLLEKIRKFNIKAEMNYENYNFSKQLKKILLHKPKYIIFIGEKEVEKCILTIKNIFNKKIYTLTVEESINFLIKELKK
ncbi:histidine--tRNA ligase [Candidatus Phytoplasma sacchari]|nr:histidine--tRNA ligase [Candidatus Phytoplasma sacchari]KAB8122739.1 histidine--tRNA ligase [Candidatus Phytoplasma sacchari]